MDDERSPDGRLDAAWIVAFTSLACLVPIWVGRYIPAVDLPQHAAQVALWTHRGDPAFFPAGTYRFNALTPYVGVYLVARAFAFVVSVPVAVKLAVSLAVVGLPLATLALIRAADGEDIWALASVPLSFGVTFFGGFLNYLFALPVAVLVIAGAFRLARRPSPRGAMLLAALSLLLAVCHAVAFAIGAVLAFGVLWAETRGLSRAVRRSLPLWVPLPLVLAWAAFTWTGEPDVRTPWSWANAGTRLLRLPATLVGSDRAIESIVALLGLGAAVALLGARLRFARAVSAALIVAGAMFLLAPDRAFHTVLLPERVAPFVAALLLAAARMPRRTWARRATAGLLAVLVVVWSAHLAVRVRRFDGEMRGLDDLLARMEPGRLVRTVPLDSESASVSGYPLFWHVGAWYQVEKGGRLSFSFSQLFASLVQYRSTPPWAESTTVRSAALRWRPEDSVFDYFVFRSLRGDPVGWFPADAGAPTLVATSRGWWLYRIRPSSRS